MIETVCQGIKYLQLKRNDLRVVLQTNLEKSLQILILDIHIFKNPQAMDSEILLLKNFVV